MSKEINSNNLIAKVSFDLPFSLYIKDGSYEIQMPSYVVAIATRRRKQEHIDTRLGIKEATDVELLRDRHGRLYYTSVEVSLPGQIAVEREIRRQIKGKRIKPEEDVVRICIDTADLISSYSEAALKEAIAIANHFVAVYREVTRAFYIRTFSRSEIYRATINWFSGDELLGGVEYGAFGKGVTLNPVGLLEATDQQFRQRLKVYGPTRLYVELYMNAKDYLDLGNYRMAVIESRTCLEVIVDQLLQTYFTEEENDIEAARNLLDVSKKRVRTIGDVLEQAKINKKLTKGLKKVLGRGLDDNVDLWRRWRKVKENREKAVHRGGDISETDAKESVDVLSEIIGFVSRN